MERARLQLRPNAHSQVKASLENPPLPRFRRISAGFQRTITASSVPFNRPSGRKYFHFRTDQHIRRPTKNPPSHLSTFSSVSHVDILLGPYPKTSSRPYNCIRGPASKKPARSKPYSQFSVTAELIFWHSSHSPKGFKALGSTSLLSTFLY